MVAFARFRGYGGKPKPEFSTLRNYTYESEHPAGGDPRRKTVTAEVVQPVALWYQNEAGVWMIRRIAELGDPSNKPFVVLPAKLMCQS